MKLNKGLLINVGLIALAGLFFGVLSQFYSPYQQIFITDSYFITPKSQPFQFILMWFATIFLILLAVYIGKVIAVFLLMKGLLFSVVGGALVVGAAILGYASLFLNVNDESTSGLIVMGIIVLFMGGLGVAMLFSPILMRKKGK